MNICPKCSLELPTGKQADECPQCLLALGLTEAIDAAAEGADRRDVFPAIGERLRYLGDYELVEEIARGGMGVVFKARQRSLNRVVAVKMILSGAFATPAEVERFRIEAEAAARLKHPGIVGIHEVGQHQGLHYFSMDYVEGPNLAERVAQNGALPPIDAARLIQQVAEALAYAHGQGTLHRDLKPQNIVIDPNGNAHIADFGLAKITNVQKDITRTGTVLGTPAYMPPEQAAGRWNEVGPQSDIYALGAVLYFAITGRPPFTADEPVSLLRKVLEQLPEAPRRDNPLIPLELENICLRALEKEARRRYASAQEFADDLGRFVRGEPVLARRPGAALRVWGWCQRHSWLGKALLAIAFLALASVAYGLWEKTQFLAWLNKYPDFKQDPVGAEKELRKVVDAISMLIFIPMLFLDYSKRHYATLVRKGRYALVLYVHAAIGTALFCHGLWAMSLSIKAHVWHGVPLGLNIWCSLLAASWGPIAWIMMFKEVRLLRLGETPEKGLSADEYQELVNLQWSLSKERTQELVREALIRGDREKAQTVDRYGRLGMSLDKFEDQLRAEGVLKVVAARPPRTEIPARRQVNRNRLIGAVMAVMFLGIGIVFYFGERSESKRRKIEKPHFVAFERAESLYRRGSSAFPELAAMLRDGSSEERFLAAQVLGRIGARAVPVLTNELRHSREEVRAWAAVSLGRMEPDQAQPALGALITLVRDESSAVRSAAAFALLRQPLTAESTEALSRMVEMSPEPEEILPWLWINDAEKPLLKICEAQGMIVEFHRKGGVYRQKASEADFNNWTSESAEYFFRWTVAEAIPKLLRSPGTNAIPIFTPLLSSSTPRLARQAAAALARIGPAAISALTDALNEEDAALNACFALGLIGQPAAEAAPALLNFLARQQVAEDGHCHPCAAAVFALNELGTNTTAGLLELAASTNLTASRYAAAALGQRASDAEALVPALAGLLSDTNWHVRAGAAMAIGDLAIKTNVVVDATLRSSLEIASTNVNPRTALPAAAALHLLDRGENANPVLTRFLAHSEARVRLAAVSAIGRATSAPPAMVDALLESLFDREGKVRARTVQILPKFAASHPKIVNALRDSLGDPHARNDAALALGAIGSAALPGLITDTKDDDPDIRDWAVFAIGHMRPTPEAGVWAVAAALNDGTAKVRATAASRLGQIANETKLRDRDKTAPLPAEVVERLVAAAADQDPRVRVGALDSLKHVGLPPDRLKRLLIAALDDSDLRVRRQAAFGLEKIALTPKALEVLAEVASDLSISVYQRDRARTIIDREAERKVAQ